MKSERENMLSVLQSYSQSIAWTALQGLGQTQISPSTTASDLQKKPLAASQDFEFGRQPLERNANVGQSCAITCGWARAIFEVTNETDRQTDKEQGVVA